MCGDPEERERSRTGQSGGKGLAGEMLVRWPGSPGRALLAVLRRVDTLKAAEKL